ncbi:Methyltransferase domain [Macleaya cordata]|uniref:Methyltransferase domain n=1 Tax=Macleaya cordata TaxID=56857 RepID=A0A200QSW5_MACCD|nr:Methyltransferase domain [Macleaya cordata]
MTLGTTTQAYGEPSYWDNRYAQDTGPFDWYQKYPALAPLLHLYVPPQNRILVVGCGNAALSEGMEKDGYQDIFNIDISSVVIEAMQKKYQDFPALKYIKMDVRDMGGFESGYFDAVIDKGTALSQSLLYSGCFLLVSIQKFQMFIGWRFLLVGVTVRGLKKPIISIANFSFLFFLWCSMSPGTLDSIMCGHNSQENAAKMLEEVGRVLKDKGVYILKLIHRAWIKGFV